LVGQNRWVVTLGVAGHAVRLEAAGSALLEFVQPAFAHLPRLRDDIPADLTVHMWDSASTGEPYPDLGLPEVERLAAGVLTAPGTVLAYNSFEQGLSLFDRTSNEAFYVVGDSALLPPWEHPCPLRNILSWWLMGQGMVLAHSAAVSTDDGAALLIGPGGSGKSSTALACLAAGMGYLGDDYVIIDPTTRTVWSLFSSAKLVVAHHDRYPELMTAGATIHHEARDDKRYGWPAIEFPDRVRLSAPIRTVVLPVVTRGPRCRLLPSTPGRALMALAPTTMFQSFALKQDIFDLCSKAVQPFRAHRLELGEGADAVPAMLSRLIASPEGLS
jgi:hypothetical protein